MSYFGQAITKPDKESVNPVQKGDSAIHLYRKNEPAEQNTHTRTYTHHALEGGEKNLHYLLCSSKLLQLTQPGSVFIVSIVCLRALCARVPFFGLLKTGGAHGAERVSAPCE